LGELLFPRRVLTTESFSFRGGSAGSPAGGLFLCRKRGKEIPLEKKEVPRTTIGEKKKERGGAKTFERGRKVE